MQVSSTSDYYVAVKEANKGGGGQNTDTGEHY